MAESSGAKVGIFISIKQRKARENAIYNAIFTFSLPILATTIEPDCAAKDVVPLMAVTEPSILPSMP